MSYFKKLRRNMSLTQIELAAHLKVDQATISRIEKGAQDVSTKILRSMLFKEQVSKEDIIILILEGK